MKLGIRKLLIRQKCKQYILKWDAVGSILKQTKGKQFIIAM
jgi:hypothetical protein